MAKPRDYKAEYRRRIASGLQRGMTRSQAAGHPRAGEPPARSFAFTNPFTAIRNRIAETVRDLNEMFRGALPGRAKERANCEVEYMEEHEAGGHRVLPRWFIGADCEPNSKDLGNLFGEGSTYRYQSSYALVICGYTSVEYPGKEGEKEICLSYRIHRSAVERALRNNENKDLLDVVEEMLPPEREEQWELISQIQILDKD